MKRVIDWAIFLCLMLAVLMLSGCAVFDWLFVPKPGGSSSDTPGAVAGTILNYFIPGAGAVVAAIGGIYGKIRGGQAKKQKKLTESTFATIEKHGDLPKAELKKELARAHKDAGVELLAKKNAEKVSPKPVAMVPPAA